MMKGQGRERRTATARVLSLTRGTKEEASARQMAAWTLWPTLMHRTGGTGAEVKRQIVMGLPILTQIV